MNVAFKFLYAANMNNILKHKNIIMINDIFKKYDSLKFLKFQSLMSVDVQINYKYYVLMRLYLDFF